MPKKSRVRSLMDGQHVKGSERPIKSARQCFCHIFYLVLKDVSTKNSFLIVSEILTLFVGRVFMLFHVLVSSGCTTSVIYVRSSDQRSFVASSLWVPLQVPSALSPNLSYFTSKDEISSRAATGEKTI